MGRSYVEIRDYQKVAMIPLKKGQLREEDMYMWGCGRSPHPHIYPSLLLAGGFFRALIHAKDRRAPFLHRKSHHHSLPSMVTVGYFRASWVGSCPVLWTRSPSR
jgi:hypothetical protein